MIAPIRVLHIFGGLNRGGSETMIMNLYRNIDRRKIQFDFIITEDNKEHAYESEIKELGGRIFRIPQLSVKNIFKYRVKFRNLLENHPEWDIVHCNYLTTSFMYLDILKKSNRFIIGHSHTSGSVSKLKTSLLRVLHKPIKKNADIQLACSIDAAKWIFEEKYNETTIIKNAIDVKTFQYNIETRNKMRKQYNLSENFIIGHIGRFNKVKNHKFIIDVFEKIIEKNKNAKLILIGSGAEKDSIVRHITKLNLNDFVILLNEQHNTNDFYQMFDVFLFPSLYEGLGMVAIEAQASGLPTIVSERIPPEAYVTNLIKSIKLDEEANIWANQILLYSKGYYRTDTSKEVFDAGYDVSGNSRLLEKIYFDIKVFDIEN